MEHSESNPTDFHKISYLELLLKICRHIPIVVNVGKCNRNFARRSACIFDTSPCLILIIEVDSVLFMVRADGEEAAGNLNGNNRALFDFKSHCLRDMDKNATFLSPRLRDIDCNDYKSVAKVRENLQSVLCKRGREHLKYLHHLCFS